MEKQEQIAQIKILMSRLDAGANVDAGGLRKNPTVVYTDPELAERERAEFFGSFPQVIGLSGDLPEPGSFLTLDEIGTPILATRDSESHFRAFVNVCRHRGVQVETAKRGSARRFTCSFHAWTYDLEGSLVGVPKQDHFGNVDLGCHGLVELPAVEYHGILIVHPEPDGVIDLDDLFEPTLDAELESWDFGRLDLLTTDAYEIECNWKLAIDTFGETYHFNSLHANTLANVFYGNVQCYDVHGRNHRMLLTRRDIDTLRELPEDDWDITTAALPVYYLFPNVQLMPDRNGCFLVRAYPHPTEPGKHTTHITFYRWRGQELVLSPEMIENGITADDFQIALAQGFANIIRDEDYVASASQQRSAESGALDYVVFGRNEPALHHYHNTYRAELGMDPLPLLDRV